jgi:hypothetical protein
MPSKGSACGAQQRRPQQFRMGVQYVLVAEQQGLCCCYAAVLLCILRSSVRQDAQQQHASATPGFEC